MGPRAQTPQIQEKSELDSSEPALAQLLCASLTTELISHSRQKALDDTRLKTHVTITKKGPQKVAPGSRIQDFNGISTLLTY